MARIEIEPARARGVLEQERSLENSLRSFSREVDSVRNGLRYKIAGQEQISARLREAAAQVAREAAATRAIQDGLSQVIQRYEQTENGNRDKAASAERTSVQENPGNSSPAPESSPYEFKWGDLLTKELANLVGPFGWIFTGGKKVLNGDLLGGAGELIKSLGKSAKYIIDKPKAEWAEYLFGLNKFTNNKSFLKRIGDFSSLGEGVNTVCNWASALISSGISNYKEFGENSFTMPRYWAETINEGAIKIGEGALIGWGVGSVALAIGGAPAIAVGAATVAVTMALDWGLNSAVRYFTGDATADWVDCLSDAILDGGKAVIDKGKTIAKEVGSAVKNTAQEIGKGFKKIGEGISSVFSGCKWGGALCGAW